jgi:hypothetical protein
MLLIRLGVVCLFVGGAILVDNAAHAGPTGTP